LTYNDGSTVEKAKYLQTYREIVAKFSGVSFDIMPRKGLWHHQGDTFADMLIKVIVDVEDTDENRAFFQSFKERLKERFDQLEIWMVAFGIEVI